MIKGIIVMGLTLATVIAVSDISFNEEQFFSARAATPTACNSKKQGREFDVAPYYRGPLADAHLHLPTSSSIVSSVSTRFGLPTPAWDKTLSLAYFDCLHTAEDTKMVFGFHLLTKYSLHGELKVARNMEKKFPGRVTHFLMPTFLNSWVDVSVKDVENLLVKNRGLFRGIGELKMFDGSGFDHPRLIGFVELAKKYGLIVMIHPYAEHRTQIEKLLATYPSVTFLLHGIDDDNGRRGENDRTQWILDLISRYPNAYYSIDTILSLYGWKQDHEKQKPGKNESLAHMRQTFTDMVQTAIAHWKPHIEAHPDRFLNGTDRWYRWHYDTDASALTIESKRSFIGALAPAVQEQFAYKNAERLLQFAASTTPVE